MTAPRDESEVRVPKTGLVLLLLILLGAGAAGMHAFCTESGMGVDSDGVIYLAVARNLARGHGLTTPFNQTARRGPGPLVHYPPLFPGALALLSGATGTALSAARLLNASLFAANVFLIGWLVFRCTGGARLGVLGAILAATSLDLLELHTFAWSEPLFIFLCLSGFILLERHLARGGTTTLIGAALLMALAWLTRYAGAAAVATGFLAILLYGPREKSVRRAALFGAVACLPMAAWLVRNLAVAGTLTNRSFAVHLISARHLFYGINTISRWLFPIRPIDLVESLGRTAAILAAAIHAALIAVLGLLAAAAMIRQARSNPAGPAVSRARPACIMLLFITCYALMMAAVISFFDAHASLTPRLLAPAFVAALVAALAFLGAGLRCPSRRRGARLVVAVVCLAVLGSYVVTSLKWAGHRHRHGAGYTSPDWRNAKTIAYLRSLPADVPIHSNAADALWFLLDRPARMLPLKVDPPTARANVHYSAELAALKTQLTREPCVVAYLNSLKRRTYFPSEAELTPILHLRHLHYSPDGSVYCVAECDDSH